MIKLVVLVLLLIGATFYLMITEINTLQATEHACSKIWNQTQGKDGFLDTCGLCKQLENIGYIKSS